jgi:hypothetical protein
VLIWQAAVVGGTEIAKGNPMDGSGLGGIYLTRCGRWIRPQQRDLLEQVWIAKLRSKIEMMFIYSPFWQG